MDSVWDFEGISFHGFALNVNLALKPFEWINIKILSNNSHKRLIL